MNHENITDDQIGCGLTKDEVRKFPRKFSKTLAKELREELWVFENKLRLYGQNLKCFENEDYLRCKLRVEEIYKIKANGVKIRNAIGMRMEKSLFKSWKKSFHLGSNWWIYNRGKRINKTKWNQ